MNRMHDTNRRYTDDAASGRSDITLAAQAGYLEGLADQLRRAAADASQPFRFPDCPEWCTDHHVHIDRVLGTEESYSLHRHTVDGDVWTVEVEEDDSEGAVAPVEFIPMDYRDPMTLGQAREYARAILAACDAVEGRAYAL